MHTACSRKKGVFTVNPSLPLQTGGDAAGIVGDNVDNQYVQVRTYFCHTDTIGITSAEV